MYYSEIISKFNDVLQILDRELSDVDSLTFHSYLGGDLAGNTGEIIILFYNEVEQPAPSHLPQEKIQAYFDSKILNSEFISPKDAEFSLVLNFLHNEKQLYLKPKSFVLQYLTNKMNALSANHWRHTLNTRSVIFKLQNPVDPMVVFNSIKNFESPIHFALVFQINGLEPVYSLDLGEETKDRSIEFNTLRKENVGMKAKIYDYSIKISDYERKIESLSASNQDLQSKIEIVQQTYNTELKNLRENKQDLTKKLDDLSTKHEKLDGELKNVGQNHQNQRNNLEEMINAQRTQISILEKERENLQNELKEQEGKIQSLTNERDLKAAQFLEKERDFDEKMNQFHLKIHALEQKIQEHQKTGSLFQSDLADVFEHLTEDVSKIQEIIHNHFPQSSEPSDEIPEEDQR